MEDNGGDEVDVLEDAEALEPADVPQPDRLVHAARQDEEVLAPGDVEQVAGVAGVGDEGPVHEDVADAVRVRHVVLDGLLLLLLFPRHRLRVVLHLVSPPHVVEVVVLFPANFIRNRRLDELYNVNLY